MLKFKKILFIATLLFAASCISIEKDIEIAGIVSWDYWKQNAGWKDYDAHDFYIDYRKLEILKEKINNGSYTFIVFATAFCLDCEEEVPKAFRVFREAGVAPNAVTLVGLDKNNEEPSGTYKKYGIKSVPSIVVLENGKEIGNVYGSFKSLIENFIEIIERK